jgi:hypothetical protein
MGTQMKHAAPSLAATMSIALALSQVSGLAQAQQRLVPSQNSLPLDGASSRFEAMLKSTIRTEVAATYIISDVALPFGADEGFPPMAKLIQANGWAFLYPRLQLTRRPMPDVPLVMLTRAAKAVYQSHSASGRDPEFVPRTANLAFLELGVNGIEPFARMLQEIGVKEGLREDRMYEFWPASYFPTTGKLMGKLEISAGQQVLWIAVSKGTITAGALTERR